MKTTQNFRKNIEELRDQNPKAFSRANLILEYGRERGFIEVDNTAMTKWNYTAGNTDDYDKPKADGTFDVEGHSSTDIQGVWLIRWWERRHWGKIPKMFKDYFEGVQEFVIEGFLKQARAGHWDLIWRHVNDWLLTNPLPVRHEGWVWVLDSKSYDMKSGAYGLAEDKIAQSLGFTDSVDRYLHKKQIGDHGSIQKLADELLSTAEGRAEVWSYVVEKSDLVQVADHVWANRNDPTCFVVDESSVLSFDMKDGWSPESTAKLIAYWFRLFYNVDVEVRISRGP